MNDERIVKASFRDCSLTDRQRFKDSHCLLPISIGQSVHEGKKFLATLALIERSFKKCTILIDDTVQWHTLQIYNPESDYQTLYNQALFEGEAWLKKYESAISQLQISHEIMRWEEWRSHPNFDSQLTKIDQLYLLNQQYKTAVDQNICDFLERNIRRTNETIFNYEYAFNCCLSYLKEECAVMSLWPEGNYDFEVYPSGRNRAMAATYQYLIQPLTPSLLKPVALRFKKYPAPLTSRFKANSLITPIKDNLFGYNEVALQ